jgi:membrane glycosyltransferase
MGNVVRLGRKRQRKRDWRQVQAEDSTRPESRQALMILVLAFTITAVVMSVAVVAEVSSTWADVLLMSIVVLVFALLKVGLADAAFWVMLRADDQTEKYMAKAAEEEKQAQRNTPQRATRSLAAAAVPARGRKAEARRSLKLATKPLEHPPATPVN